MMIEDTTLEQRPWDYGYVSWRVAGRDLYGTKAEALAYGESLRFQFGFILFGILPDGSVIEVRRCVK